MKTISPQRLAGLQAAPDTGITPRVFAFFTVRNRTDGAPVSIGMWNGDWDVTLDVVNGFTGLTESRTYYGECNLVVGDVQLVTDLSIQTLNVSMSQLAPPCQQLARTYDPRLGKVEIHKIELDRLTRMPVSAPEIDFMGEIDGAPIETPRAGSDGSIQYKINSDAISMLAIVNPRKSSYEGQRRRSGDEFGKYASTVGDWKIPWGQEAK